MQINDDELLELISQTTWTFAKTYANTFPHEYIKRTDYPDLFELMKQAIVTRGYDAKFFKATYRYFHIGGYKYWGPPKYTLILNREKLPEEKPPEVKLDVPI